MVYRSLDTHPAVLPNGTVLVAGGTGALRELLSSCGIYDPATGLWSVTDRLMSARWLRAGASLADGRVLVVGGSSGFGQSFDDADLYAPAQNMWKATADLNIVRRGHSATLFPTVAVHGDRCLPLPVRSLGKAMPFGKGTICVPNNRRVNFHSAATCET